MNAQVQELEALLERVQRNRQLPRMPALDPLAPMPESPVGSLASMLEPAPPSEVPVSAASDAPLRLSSEPAALRDISVAPDSSLSDLPPLEESGWVEPVEAASPDVPEVITPVPAAPPSAATDASSGPVSDTGDLTPVRVEGTAPAVPSGPIVRVVAAAPTDTFGDLMQRTLTLRTR